MLKELVNHVGGAELEAWLRRAVKGEVNAKGVCLCGPSGTGKSALVGVLKVAFPEMVVTVMDPEPGDCRGKIVVLKSIDGRKLNGVKRLCEVANVMLCVNAISESGRRFDVFTQEARLSDDAVAALKAVTEADVAGFRAWLLG